MRALLIAVLLVVGTGGTAEARRGGGGIVIIVTGDDIEHLRDLPADLAAELGYGKLGYHYDRFGLFWLDLWRSGGEFVVYDGNTYAPITADELELLGGASVPWRYHLPPLLLVILCGIAALIIRRRSAKVGYIAGGILVAIAALFYFKGLTWEFMIPGFTGLYHVLASYWATKAHRDEEVIVAEAPVVVEKRVTASGAFKTTSSGAMRPLATASGEHRAIGSGPISSRPSQPIVPIVPIVIDRPSRPSQVPMRPDDKADAPKLLR